MNEEGIKGLLEDKFEMGGEAGVVAGPVGREVAASTNTTLDAGILSYSRSKGAFIGAALKGAVISPDNDLNEAVYGIKATEVLTGKPIPLKQDATKCSHFPAHTCSLLGPLRNRNHNVLLGAQQMLDAFVCAP